MMECPVHCLQEIGPGARFVLLAKVAVWTPQPRPYGRVRLLRIVVELGVARFDVPVTYYTVAYFNGACRSHRRSRR